MMNTAYRPAAIVSAILATTLFASAQMAKGPTYRDPDPTGPKVRVDGRNRGTDDALLTLTVLAPERVGLTTKPQPSLFWYQSRAAKTHFELTICDRKAVTPLLEVKIATRPVDGIQRVRLSDFQVTLAPGVDYRWAVSLVIDEENRSRDVLASGMIRRTSVPPKLAERLTGAKPDDLPFIYADEGYWYDSLEALSDLIDRLPEQKVLHEHRAVYFMQAGLPEAAVFDMRTAGHTVSSSNSNGAAATSKP